MKDSDYIPESRSMARSRYEVLRTAVILYATLAVLALTVPANLVNWLKGLRPSHTQELLIPYAEKLEKFSERVGADVPYKRVRGLFLKWTGKDED